jgi:hypothetical protein
MVDVVFTNESREKGLFMNAPLTVVAMTPCWYTREHLPADAPRFLREGGPAYARCRHCHRDIVSSDQRHWDIAGGFDAEAAGLSRAAAYLSVVDVVDEMVIARVPIGKIPDEAGVQALRLQLRADYRMDQADSALVLRDSRQRDDARPGIFMRRTAIPALC